MVTFLQKLHVQQQSSKGAAEKIHGGMHETVFYAQINHYTLRVYSEYLNSYDDTLKKFVARQIASVPEVEYIYCQREEHAYFVWILINKLDQNVRKKIYAKQREIIDLFSEEIFDFYIVARLDTPADTVITGPELVYKKQQ
ncbi:MAG TPA: hypothetical protein VJ044_17220 [Candidatus Hodarchaeales archaeon]|nr:hypothetical protein [Candidatus Hodarchaeales archaeon]